MPLRLPLVLPLSGVSDGQRVVCGPLLFCVHSEPGAPSSPGPPNHTGPSYVSVLDGTLGERRKATVPLLDSVSFSLIKKVSRVLEGDHAKPSGAEAVPPFNHTSPHSPGEGFLGRRASRRQVGVGAPSSRFDYRLYFRLPVPIALGPAEERESGATALTSWIGLTMDQAALSSWKISSPELCDSLVLCAMRCGAGKAQHRMVSLPTAAAVAAERAAARASTVAPAAAREVDCCV